LATHNEKVQNRSSFAQVFEVTFNQLDFPNTGRLSSTLTIFDHSLDIFFDHTKAVNFHSRPLIDI